MTQLQTEVRTAFNQYDEIDAASTTPLPYLKAVIQEAMRIFPPLPFALPRVVPTEGSTVDNHFLPGGVSIRSLNALKGIWLT
jgi:cytochrome P450